MVSLALNSVYERTVTVDPLGFTRLDPVMDAEFLRGLQKANQLTDHTAYEILQHDHHLHVWQARGHGRVQSCGLYCIKDLEFGNLSDKLQALHMQDRNLEAVLLKVFEILGTFNATFNAYPALSSHGAILSPECILIPAHRSGNHAGQHWGLGGGEHHQQDERHSAPPSTPMWRRARLHTVTWL